MKRLTRKEIVQVDRIQASLNAVSGWATRNRYLLVTVLGVFVITLLASYAWQQYQRGQDQELQARFGEALEQYHEAIVKTSPPPAPEGATTGGEPGEGEPEADGPADAGGDEDVADGEGERRARLQEVASVFGSLAADHPDASLGLLALYYRALVRQELGMREEAEQDLGKVVAESGQPEVRNLARRLLAQLAQSGDVERATVLLEGIVNESPDPFPRDGVLLQIARNHEQVGRPEEALEYYRRLTSEYPASAHLQEARSRISQLGPEPESEPSEEASGSEAAVP